MMNVCWRLAATAIVILASVVGLSAESVSQLRATGYVNDFAQVLDPVSKAQIEDIAHQVDDKAHAQIALVTIHSLDGVDVESFAVDLFKKWGIGNQTTDRGVLILYAIEDRRSRIEVGYGLEPILNDAKVGGFQREAAPLMQNGDYNKALLLVTSRVASVIAQDAGVQITGEQPQAAEPAQPEHGLSMGAVLAIVIVAIIVLLTPPLRRLLFWILFSQVIGGGSGRSRSGWGGFGGGGGFGGFGGGSSGGGGASSRW